MLKMLSRDGYFMVKFTGGRSPEISPLKNYNSKGIFFCMEESNET
jgi:hypothetical protein